jgi:hypothetical protein
MRFLVDLERELQRIWARFTAGFAAEISSELSRNPAAGKPVFCLISALKTPGKVPENHDHH